MKVISHAWYESELVIKTKNESDMQSEDDEYSTVTDNMDREKWKILKSTPLL